MSQKQIVPNTLRMHREQAGLFQKDVARILNLDCMDRISRWENGVAMPSVVNLFRLASIYGVLPHDLYPGLVEAARQPRFQAENT
jgi:transcriptional regulator with XRE-family HTH domain